MHKTHKNHKIGLKVQNSIDLGKITKNHKIGLKVQNMEKSRFINTIGTKAVLYTKIGTKSIFKAEIRPKKHI